MVFQMHTFWYQNWAGNYIFLILGVILATVFLNLKPKISFLAFTQKVDDLEL